LSCFKESLDSAPSHFTSLVAPWLTGGNLTVNSSPTVSDIEKLFVVEFSGLISGFGEFDCSLPSPQKHQNSSCDIESKLDQNNEEECNNSTNEELMVKLPPLKNKDYSDLKHHHQNT
jgi:hypothetical protein